MSPAAAALVLIGALLFGAFLLFCYVAESTIAYARKQFLAQFGPRSLRKEVHETFWRR